MAKGPFELFEYNNDLIKKAIATIDGLLSSPKEATAASAELPEGPGQGKKVRPPIVIDGATVTIRLLDLSVLSKYDCAAIVYAYKGVGWASVSIGTSADGTHTKVILRADKRFY